MSSPIKNLRSSLCAVALSMVCLGIAERSWAECPKSVLPGSECPRQWTGWSALPGAGVSDTPPEAVSVGNRIYVFAVSGQHAIVNAKNLLDGTWTGWSEVPGAGRTDRGLASVVFGSSLYLFAKGVVDKRIYVNIMGLQGSSWGGWQLVPGGATTDQPLSAAAARGKLYLFATGIDKRIRFNVFSIAAGSGVWTGWQEVPGGGLTETSLASASTPDSLYLVHRGLDSRIYLNRLEVTTGSWTGWGEIPGGGRTDLGLRAAIVGSELALVSHGIGDAHQYLNRMTLVDRVWLGWSSVSGGGTTAATTAVASADGSIFLFSTGAAVKQIYMNELGKDGDCDRLADSQERELLARFRPYYRFSLDPRADQNHPSDKYRPTDALWFVKNSVLLDARVQGSNVIVDSPVLSLTPEEVLKVCTSVWGCTDRRKGPDAATPYQLKIALNHRTGEPDWAKIKSQAVGLYGHVCPLDDGFKIEYWQFYAFNDAPVDAFAHEGDLETIQLVVERDRKAIRRIIHEVHGKRIVFGIAGANVADLGDGFREYSGTNYYAGYIDLHVDGPAGIGRAQQNLVRVYCWQGECTHPVAYIEHSGHAMWPSQHWSWPGARRHEGDDRHYLVETPCNLGEVRAPLTSCAGADIILHFNGRWGAYGDSDPGPSLRGTWGTP